MTLLGWSFKKDTNDSRESAAIYVADILLEEGAELHIYDPMVKAERIHQDLTTLWEARNESKSVIAAKLKRCLVRVNHKDALENAFAAAILTEWDEFKSYDWNAIAKKMIQPVRVFDGRNILQGNKLINQYFIGK